MQAALLTFSLLLAVASALYSAKGPVVQVGDSDFDKEVMRYPGVVIVEFYAPWCGHCKQLAPEYEKAAKILNGVVKVVAVDATVHQASAQKYGVQGYPTLKVFGADKKKPADFNGQRTSDAIVAEAMRTANQLIKDRKAGKAKLSEEKASSSDKKEKKEKKAGGKKGKSAVVELTESNFEELVLNSNDHWLVEFYAPWCGHCKKLAPEWEAAAATLAPEGVKLGALDATAATNLASRYEIKGFPTIKLFAAGPKTTPVDYPGARDADAIVEYARRTLDAAGVPIPIHQLTSEDVYESTCKSSKICAILFVPHILDTGAKGRNDYLQVFQEVAKGFRKMPIAFLWSEVGAQQKLEDAIQLHGNVPTMAVISVEKNVYTVPKVSWTKKNMATFLTGVFSNKQQFDTFSGAISVAPVAAWDGKDGEPIAEPSLDELYGQDEL